MSLITYITAVIYKPRQVSFCSCIDNRVLIHSKQVTGTNAHFLITPFTDIRYRLSDDLSNILGHHFIRCYWFLCKQSPVVNTWLGKSKLFLTHLQNNKTRRMHWEEENLEVLHVWEVLLHICYTLACVARVSIWFRTKERPSNGILGFGRARNETRAKKWKWGEGEGKAPPLSRSFTCAIFRAVFDSRSSFFAPKAHGNACYAG